MKRKLLAVPCVMLLALCAYVGARGQNQTVKINLRLLDAATGKDQAGIVRILAADGKAVSLPPLFERMVGLGKAELALGWHVVPAGGGNIMLPRGQYRLQALCGLESRLLDQELDLQKNTPARLWLKLDFFTRPEDSQLFAGNTHLHLKGDSLDQASDYLRKIPPADRLHVLFISYLERVKDDLLYITNRFPVGDLPQFDSTGVLINNGQEHRHNFKAYGEGYGHVMFLNIKKLVQPPSIGPGLTGKGVDDLPLRMGIDNARNQGGTILWCHNTNGFEDVLNALTGRLHGINFFDGSRTGSFEESYYRYLNLGIRMPASTGTDWFMYDFARVYAHVPGKLTIPAWLDAVKAGRCTATNGPLLSLTVDGKSVGDTIRLTQPGTVKVKASALGRSDFQTLQLVHNGRVIKTQPSEGKGPYASRLSHEVRLDAPGWLAVRIDTKNKNELERPLYAHSSPVYVELGGKTIFDVDSAQALLKQVEEGRTAIEARGLFSTKEAKVKMLALYDDAARDLRERINKRN